MKRFYLILFILLFSLPSFGIRYVYDFRDVPIAKALASIVKDHPEAKITFIYDELENYTTSAKINTDDLKSAVKAIVGNNPISVTVKKKQILVEAMQKGKYVYTGILLNEYKEPVIHATVLLLNPQDSVVITYGITKNDGRFVIPCDRRPVIAKISSTGYQPIIKDFTTTQLGKIRINTRAINLEKVTITPDEARMLSDRTIFVPQQRQKNTSMTGIELLERIGIPQVRINPDNGSVETNTGKPVNLFIDYTEATNSDLSGMNIQDVKRVEYYEFPSDPRFLGKRYVVNFIMTRYEYGGYTRLYGYEYTISNNQNLQMNSRFQYKK